MKPRSRAHNRIMSRRKALRKKRLDACISYSHEPFYNNLHQFSKNKIHCSCPMCSPKTRNKGRRNKNNYARAINYKISDLRRQIAMDDDELDSLGSSNSVKRKIDNL